LDRRLGGPQKRSGCGGEEKNSQPPPGIETPRTPIVQPAAQRYMSYHGSRHNPIAISILYAKNKGEKLLSLRDLLTDVTDRCYNLFSREYPQKVETMQPNPYAIGPPPTPPSHSLTISQQTDSSGDFYQRSLLIMNGLREWLVRLNYKGSSP
jgi:hypothetical protein